VEIVDDVLEIAGVRHYLRHSPGATAGVLLVPHVYGVDDFMLGFAAALADCGLLSVVWNPYPDLPWGAKFEQRPPRPDDERTLAGLSDCLEAMKQRFGINAAGTLGFCMGGRFALLHAARDSRVAAAVLAYPTIPPVLSAGQHLEPLAAVPDISCPVQVLYGGQDTITTRPVFEALQTSLQARDAETSISVFPLAGHGFFAHPSPANDAASRAGTPQIKAFLLAHLQTEV
jgi:carboxymethylenebutenolidase